MVCSLRGHRWTRIRGSSHWHKTSLLSHSLPPLARPLSTTLYYSMVRWLGSKFGDQVRNSAPDGIVLAGDSWSPKSLSLAEAFCCGDSRAAKHGGVRTGSVKTNGTHTTHTNTYPHIRTHTFTAVAPAGKPSYGAVECCCFARGGANMLQASDLPCKTGERTPRLQQCGWQCLLQWQSCRPQVLQQVLHCSSGGGQGSVSHAPLPANKMSGLELQGLSA